MQAKLPKWFYILAYLTSLPEHFRYCQRLCKLSISKSHLRTNLFNLLLDGYILQEKKGRIKYIKVTSKGVTMASKIWPLVQDINDDIVKTHLLVYPWKYNSKELEKRRK